MACVIKGSTGGLWSKVKGSSEADGSVTMPGLMACQDEFSPIQPIKGARIAVFSRKIDENVDLRKILIALGAEVREASGYISTEDHAAAAIACNNASVYPSIGKTPEEYWRCIRGALVWGLGGGGLDLIVDNDGDATILIHEGVKAEEIFAKTGQLPVLCSPDNDELQIVLTMIGDELMSDARRYHKIKERLIGVTVETTTAVERLLQMQANETLSFPAINLSDSVLNRNKLFNLYNRCLSDMMGASNISIREKKAVVFGYEEADKACATALKKAGAYVSVLEVDPNHATQALLGGFPVTKTLDDVVSKADMLVTTGINKGNNIIIVNCLKKMTHRAIILNMDPTNVFPETNSSVVVLTNTEYPNLVMSWACTSRVVALLDMWSKRGSDDKYENKVHVLDESLQEKVSALHVPTMMAAGKEETKARADHVTVAMEEQGSGFFPIGTTEAKKIDMKRIILMAAQACSILGIVAFGITTASKVKMELSLCAIWE